MIIKCYGARGSIPTSGKQYDKYGGDTTCIKVQSKNDDLIVVDAGTGIRRLGNELLNSDIKKIHLLFTHVHWDHLLGFPFFKPLFFERFEIHIYACLLNNVGIEKVIDDAMRAPYFPINRIALQAKLFFHELKSNDHIEVGSIKIKPIPLSHPNGGNGYIFEEDGKKFVFLTDNELGYQHEGCLTYNEYVDYCQDVDLLIHDAEYTPQEYNKRQTWGHSSYTDTVDLAIKANVKNLGMFHHNQDRNDKEIDKIIKSSRDIIRKQQAKVKCFGSKMGQEISL